MGRDAFSHSGSTSIIPATSIQPVQLILFGGVKACWSVDLRKWVCIVYMLLLLVTGLYTCMAQILVLLDVNPEESMLDEGLAREVVNRIQKLRKKVMTFSVVFFCMCFHQ